MGGCQCNAAKTISQEIEQEMTVNAVEPNKQSQSRGSEKQNNEKRRGKNALIVHNDAAQISDNVEYDESAQIGMADIGEIKKALKKHFIFSQMNAKEIDCFINEMRPCTAHRNTYVFKQGDKSGAYYIILEGVCQVEINGQKKRTLAYGDSFGDLGIIYNAPRSASVLAVTDCELAEINRTMFKKVMDDINQFYEKETKRFLQVLTFFKELTEEQKNAIASCCLTETYEEGQVIFNLGDDANSFYVIKEGIVVIKEKNQELKEKDCFGENSILEGGTRTNTLVAKTACKIISMSRQNIKTSLGDSLKNVMRKNVVRRIITEAKLGELIEEEKLKEGLENAEFTQFKKGELIFKKDSQHKNCIYVLLNAQIKGATAKYDSNSLLRVGQIYDKADSKVKEDIFASEDGALGRIIYSFQNKSTPSPSPLSISMKQKNDVPMKQDKAGIQKKMQISDFHVVRKLRQGNFGKVYACWNHKTAKMYAIKVLDRQYVEKSQIIQYIMNEQEILRTVPKNPFIVGFHKLIKDTNFIYFIMEFIQGEDLFDAITKVVSFTVEHTRFLVAQMLLMMEHMHSNRIIYRDLKPENLMMNTDGYLTLVDMGTAKRLKIQRRFRTSTIIGTPHYIAPEIITGKGYSFPVDLWSLGVITYELFCGKLPFGQNSEDPFTIYEQVINSSVKYPRNCPKSSKAFIQRFLSRSPQHRIGGGYEQLKKHIFFQGLDWKLLFNKQMASFYKPNDEMRLKEGQIERALAKEKNRAPGRFLTDKNK